MTEQALQRRLQCRGLYERQKGQFGMGVAARGQANDAAGIQILDRAQVNMVEARNRLK